METGYKEIKSKKYTNHLINESSPYLLQHAHNPVEWYPWSDEAIERARTEDKPIFLSIGYTACHWCHVMEKESFENDDIASILNENFVSIKVDREQRPDLDKIYMAATQAISGTGGWPMSVFLTPDLKPFYAGTYFPPDDRYGRPGFKRLLADLVNTYQRDRERVSEYAAQLTAALHESYAAQNDGVELDKNVITNAVRYLMNDYDRTYGGFGSAPKFPHPTELAFLLKVYASEGGDNILEAVEKSLISMANGGIYDQVGGGFHRYSTDARWLVPHFEKMLYDNALLAGVYSETFQLTGNEFYRKTASETLDFMIRELQDESGGFYSSLDADSEGEEGRFYVWTREEADSLLGTKTQVFSRYYNITANGNFENQTNILNIDQTSEDFRKRSDLDDRRFSRLIAESKGILFRQREKRERPFTDDKIITSWNGLAISGLSKGFQATRDSRYRAAALKAAEFIKYNLYTEGILTHSYRDGKKSDGLFLEDYAYLSMGLIDLYEISYDYEWIEMASGLAEKAINTFSDETGNLYLSPDNLEDHYMRPKDIGDGALPAPGSVFIQVLLKLGGITGKDKFRVQAEKYLNAVSGNIAGMPQAMISAVTAYYYLISSRTEIVIIGNDDFKPLLDELYRHYLPNRVIVVSETDSEKIPLLEGRKPADKAQAFVCKDFTCRIPADSPEELKRQLDQLRHIK